MLTKSAYADDRHLRSRMAIYAYAETAGDPRWRTSVIPWDGTQIVADVGCGNGYDLRQIVPQGRCRHAIGLDLSAGMLRSLEDLRQSGSLSLVQADAQRLPLPDGSVDVAMAMHMLYHVPDIPAAIRELRRITKRGGTVLASTNSSAHLAEIDDQLSAAISSQLGRPAQAMPALSFTTQNGTAVLGREFSSVTLRTLDVPLSIPPRSRSSPTWPASANPPSPGPGSRSTSTRCSRTSPCRSNRSSRPTAVSGPPRTWAYSSAARPLPQAGPSPDSAPSRCFSSCTTATG